MNKKVNVAFGLLTVLAFGGFVYSFKMNVDNHEKDKTAIEVKIEDAKKKLTEENKAKDSIKEQTTLNLKNAVAKGVEVANLQNSFKSYYKSGDTDRILETSKKLSEFFNDDDSKGKSSWYAPMASVGSEWVFLSNYGFQNDEVDVVWTNKDDEGTLLAYSLAKYDARSNKFKDVFSKITSYGRKYLGTDSAPAGIQNEKDGDE